MGAVSTEPKKLSKITNKLIGAILNYITINKADDPFSIDYMYMANISIKNAALDYISKDLTNIQKQTIIMRFSMKFLQANEKTVKITDVINILDNPQYFELKEAVREVLSQVGDKDKALNLFRIEMQEIKTDRPIIELVKASELSDATDDIEEDPKFSDMGRIVEYTFAAENDFAGDRTRLSAMQNNEPDSREEAYLDKNTARAMRNSAMEVSKKLVTDIKTLREIIASTQYSISDSLFVPFEKQRLIDEYGVTANLVTSIGSVHINSNIEREVVLNRDTQEYMSINDTLAEHFASQAIEHLLTELALKHDDKTRATKLIKKIAEVINIADQLKKEADNHVDRLELIIDSFENEGDMEHSIRAIFADLKSLNDFMGESFFSNTIYAERFARLIQAANIVHQRNQSQQMKIISQLLNTRMREQVIFFSKHAKPYLLQSEGPVAKVLPMLTMMAINRVSVSEHVSVSLDLV